MSGSIWVALRAGTYVARSDKRPSPAITPTYVTVSRGTTWKSMPLTSASRRERPHHAHGQTDGR